MFVWPTEQQTKAREAARRNDEGEQDGGEEDDDDEDEDGDDDYHMVPPGDRDSGDLQNRELTKKNQEIQLKQAQIEKMAEKFE